MDFSKSLLTSIKYLLFLTAVTPLIYTSSAIFPFVIPKTFFFRSLIEIAFTLCLVYLFFNFANLKTPKESKLPAEQDYKSRRQASFLRGRLINLIKNPLLIFLAVFFMSAVISVIFANTPYRAFWGTLERGEGLFAFLHFYAFLAMSFFVFDKEDWLAFLKITAIVGAVVIFYGFLQFNGVKDFPFMPKDFSTIRPGSFIGNPAFFAAYLVLLIIISAFLFFESLSLSLKFWKYFSLFLIFASALMVFITATRGAILGIGAGIIFLPLYFISRKKSIFFSFYKFRNISSRSIALVALILFAAFIGVFLLTKTNNFWQNIPGFNRLSQTKLFDKNDGSTQMRLMVWQAGLKAFPDRPLAGWGLENYITAFSKYYNPDYALFGETWHDRPHNKIIEILVTQGILGLIAYLGIIGAVFYLLSKQQLNYSQLQPNYNQLQKPVLMAGFIAYFVQNLFLFDEINSYLLLFTVFSFLSSIFLQGIDSTERINSHLFISKARTQGIRGKMRDLLFKSQIFDESNANVLSGKKYFKLRSALIFFFSGVIILIGYSLYAYNYIPFVQSQKARLATQTDNRNDISNLFDKTFYPYNFSQAGLRAYVIDDYYSNRINIFEDPKFGDLSSKIETALEEIIQKEPEYDPRWYIRKNQIFNERAKNNPEPKWYFEAEKAIRKGLELSPTRQEFYYGLAFSLAGQNRVDEAVKAAEDALKLSPNVARAHYHLGLMKAIAGRKEEAIAEFAKVQKIDPHLDTLMFADKTGIALTYSIFKRFDLLADFVMQKIDGKINFDAKIENYQNALYYYIIQHDSQNAIKVAQYLSQSPQLKDDMEVIIDLLQKGDWEILEKL